jgi:hypothetical protein
VANTGVTTINTIVTRLIISALMQKFIGRVLKMMTPDNQLSGIISLQDGNPAGRFDKISGAMRELVPPAETIYLNPSAMSIHSGR